MVKNMVFQPLCKNFKRWKSDTFTTGSDWTMLLLPKVSISGSPEKVYKTEYLKKTKRDKAKILPIFTLASDLTYCKISIF